MKYILLSAFLLLTVISTYGQTDNSPQPCTLKLSQAPSVRGVRLSMTVDELLPLFPGSNESNGVHYSLATAEGYPQFGETSFVINPSNWANKEQFAGVAEYYFRLFDRRIVALTARYDQFPKGARWKNPDDLIQRLSDSLHLPGPKEWVPDPGNTTKRLKCDGFEVVISAGDQGTIYFYDRSWEGTKKERQAAFEEQKRREFKP